MVVVAFIHAGNFHWLFRKCEGKKKKRKEKTPKNLKLKATGVRILERARCIAGLVGLVCFTFAYLASH